MTPLDELPGFRRRFRITPEAASVCAEVEDDFHHMSVTLRHDGKTATALDPVMQRVPWTICPGALTTIRDTFTGIALADFAARGEKRENCTHLYDLALLAAAHAEDREILVMDILVSDPIDSLRRAEIRRNGEFMVGWVDSKYKIVEPPEIAGISLDKLRPWIDSLTPPQREAARLLQWGAILAHGRSRPVAKQSDASSIGVDRCYTFQSRRVASAVRIDAIRDFSNGKLQPLERPL